MKRWTAALLFLGVAVALALRAGDLAFRPLHNDEAINAFKLQQLLTHGEFHYDPEEYHGPTLYYLALPVVRIVQWFRPNQPDEVGMRWVTVVFGVGLVFLLGFVVDGLGRVAVGCAALFTAVSPAFVYYSRYFIHEMLLVFFSFLAIAALWRYVRRPGIGWAMGLGAALGAMYATKETFVFSGMAMALAGIGTRLWLGRARARDEDDGEDLVQTLIQVDQSLVARAVRRVRQVLRAVHPWHCAAAIGTGVVVALVFFTSFFTYPRGAWDALRTYLIWAERAGGTATHGHPWYFYFERLLWFRVRGGPVWSEAGLVLLALVGMASVLAPSRFADSSQRWLVCFLSLYTLVLTTIYCLIPYKTPWCFLGFLHGVILLAGVGAAALLTMDRRFIWRVMMAPILALVTVQLSLQAWRTTRTFAADFRNPYVYGHTSADIYNLLDQLDEVAAAHPAGLGMPIHVMAPDNNYWPLPWYLRRFKQVGWWDRVPEDPYASVMICASKLGVSFEEKSNRAWLMVGLFELRPRFFVELYVEGQLWDRFLAARAASRSVER